MNVADLSAEELVMRVRSLNAEGNRLLARLLVHLGEVDRRALYKQHACSSMFAFCRKLGMSEGSASRRIDSARAIRKFPQLVPLIERGELHLTALSIVFSILTAENIDTVIAAVAGKTRLEVEEIKVRYAPRATVKDSIRKMPEPSPLPALAALASEAAQMPLAPPPVAVTENLPKSSSSESAPAASEPHAVAVAAECTPAQATFPEAVAPPPVAVTKDEPAMRVAPRITPVVPLREDAYKVQFTASKAIVDKIEHVKAMMRHRNPKGELAGIVDAALDLLIAKLEKERFGKTSRPQKVQRPCKPGHVSQAKRREVFERDGIQCTYVDASGTRCTERGCLEIDHVRAKGRKGGEETPNLRVYCRAHNQMHAKDDFGAAFIERKIDAARRTRDARRAFVASSNTTSTPGGSHSAGGGDRSFRASREEDATNDETTAHDE